MHKYMWEGGKLYSFSKYFSNCIFSFVRNLGCTYKKEKKKKEKKNNHTTETTYFTNSFFQIGLHFGKLIITVLMIPRPDERLQQ